MEQLTKEKETLTRETHEITLQRSAKQALHESELSRIPEELRSPEQLAARLAAQRGLADRLSAAWREAQQELQRTQTALAEENAALKQMAKQLEEADEQLTEADERLSTELAKAGFATLDEYRAARLAETVMQNMRDDIEAFKTGFAVLQQQLEELEKELADRRPADLERLNSELAGFKQELEAASAEQRSTSLAKEAERLRASMQSAYAKQRELEAKLEQVLDVYQVLKGDNPLKISFERYILIEFLEQILAVCERTVAGAVERPIRAGAQRPAREA
ncbi:hypothetical protein LJK88_38920 [Paenibacillus sp. P26]|nr:hypothetical protein LJK88_38920 [Paenibacillus sp. P26]